MGSEESREVFGERMRRRDASIAAMKAEILAAMRNLDPNLRAMDLEGDHERLTDVIDEALQALTARNIAIDSLDILEAFQGLLDDES